MKEYEESKNILQHPIKQGQVCVVQCDEDKQFYRVRVERVTKNLVYTLYFIDHGLYEDKEKPTLFKATPKLL